MLDRLRRFIRPAETADTTPDEDEPPMIDHHEARQAQQDGALLIDVRETDEWQAGHIAEARLHPLPRIASDPDIDLPMHTPLVTYCRVGARADRAAEILRAAGYDNVRVMAGGYADWRDAGYPVA